MFAIILRTPCRSAEPLAVAIKTQRLRSLEALAGFTFNMEFLFQRATTGKLT